MKIRLNMTPATLFEGSMMVLFAHQLSEISADLDEDFYHYINLLIEATTETLKFTSGPSSNSVGFHWESL